MHERNLSELMTRIKRALANRYKVDFMQLLRSCTKNIKFILAAMKGTILLHAGLMIDFTIRAGHTCILNSSKFLGVQASLLIQASILVHVPRIPCTKRELRCAKTKQSSNVVEQSQNVVER